jgi:hypothetical protein
MFAKDHHADFMMSSKERSFANAALVEADLQEPAEANTFARASNSTTQCLNVSFEAELPVDETNKETDGTFQISLALNKKRLTALIGQIRNSCGNQPTDWETEKVRFILHFRFSQKKNRAQSSKHSTRFSNFHTSSTRQPVANSSNKIASFAQAKNKDGMGCSLSQFNTT